MDSVSRTWKTYGVGCLVDGGDGAMSWAVADCGGTLGDGISDNGCNS